MPERAGPQDALPGDGSGDEDGVYTLGRDAPGPVTVAQPVDRVAGSPETTPRRSTGTPKAGDFPDWHSVEFFFPTAVPPARPLIPGQSVDGAPDGSSEPDPEAGAEPGADAEPGTKRGTKRAAKRAAKASGGKSGRQDPGTPGEPVAGVSRRLFGGRRPPLLALLAVPTLLGGALTGTLLAMLLGWVLVYGSRRLSERTRKFAVLGIPLLSATCAGIWLWGRTAGRWGAPLATGHPLSLAAQEAGPTVLRVAAGLTAVYLVVVVLRQSDRTEVV